MCSLCWRRRPCSSCRLCRCEEGRKREEAEGEIKENALAGGGRAEGAAAGIHCTANARPARKWDLLFAEVAAAAAGTKTS
jgi:hypothetical protein